MSELPSSFSTLFGPIDHAEGNESRSVLSPTAYLVDLLMLTENTGYHQRRPDVGRIPLDEANTYTELPQLDIANRVMGELVSPDELTERVFPAPLPFSEQFLRLQLYAEKLGTSLEELQRLYRAAPDAHLSARLLLGLSQQEFDFFITARDAAIEELWGTSGDQLTRLRNGDVELIKRKLKLSLKELKLLVRQDLSVAELGEGADNPAARFFINQGAPHIVLNDAPGSGPDEVLLRLSDGSLPTDQHLDRMMRFVRLARRFELTFPELDWLLQTTSGEAPPSFVVRLDRGTLQALSVALRLRALGDLPIDELCSLWGVIKSHGRGDATLPGDLFSRLYDNGFPSSLEDLVGSLTNTSGLEERLQATLRLSGADFVYLKSALRERGVVQPTLVLESVIVYFTAFRRVVTLASLLSLDVREMVALLDVLGAQWTVSDDYDLHIPTPYSAPGGALNPLALLAQPDVPARQILDVLQKIARVKAWLDLHELTPRQLAFICLADHAAQRARLDDGAPIDDVQTDDVVEATLADIAQSLSELLLLPSALQTGSLSANGAQAVFEALVEARVLTPFGVNGRALLRVEPRREELAAAMQAGIQERLALNASDLTALGFTDIELVLSLLVARGYLELVQENVPGETSPELHYFVAPGLTAYFGDPNGAAAFNLPNYALYAAALFAALAARVNAARVEPAALVAAGVDAEDVPALFSVLLARGHVAVVPASSPVAYRVADDAKVFFQDAANVERFALPDFSSAFAALANKVETYKRADANRLVEAEELRLRLAASAEQQTRIWLRTLAGFLSLSEDLTELAVAWTFGTPDETLVQTLANAAAVLLTAKESGEKLLSLAYLASRGCRLQQLALLLRKTGMSADEARVFLTNQALHRGLPETLKLPAGFDAAPIDALTTLPSGDFLIVSGPRYAAFDRRDYRLKSTGSLDQIPGVTLSGTFRTRVLDSGLDAAFSTADAEGNPVLQLCSGDQYVTVSASGTSAVKVLAEWGRVRNHIQQNAHVDAALSDDQGHLYLFSGDQYVRYDQPQGLLNGTTFVDERYPKSIRGKFEAERPSPLPAAMFSKVDAAFLDGDGSYYFFSGNRFTHSDQPYSLLKIRPDWGHVLNYLFEDNRVDAAFVLGNATYLTRKNQLTRYTGPAYQIVDERFPVSFGNIAESEPLLRVLRRFAAGIDAALAGRDGQLYAFKSGSFASSAAPDTPLVIRDRWGRVRNVFIDNQRVDGALHYNGVLYLFCGDQYVRYSTANYEFVDEGYPKRVHANWNTVEHVGQLPAGLPLPVTAVVVGRTPSGTTDDLYFFGGNQYAGPSGALDSVKAQWARVRNNIERTGIVDAALLDGSGRMYLFSGDQFYRYSSAEQPFADETYPRRLTGNWAQEGTGYSLPDAFTVGISAALRGGDGRLFFFSGQSYARVDASPVATPRPVAQDWGVVRNWIQAQNRVGSAFVDPSGNTYLFGGDQFVRYSTSNYDFADEGYPLTIGTRWGNLPESFRSDIDASLLFRSPVDNVQRLYLFKGDNYVRYSTSNYAQLDAGYPKRLRDGIAAEGLWFRGFTLHELPPFPLPNDYIDVVEATYVDTYNNQPRIFVFYSHGGAVQWRREYRNGNWLSPVPMNLVNDYLPFTRLDAAFVAADGTLHAFSGEQHASRPPAGGAMTTPVATRTRWARVRNQFAELGRVDASLSMADGRSYLFCATQYIKYSAALRPGDADFYVDEGYPKRIAPNWPNESVAISLVPELQATGYDLCRDAAGKIHFFNGTRYNFSGNAGADLLLTSRWGKVLNRFQDLDRVDGAYRAENGKLYLFTDTQFTRYSGALSPGSPEFYADEGYPRRVSAWWAAEALTPAMPNTWSAQGSAVFRDAQQTYAFSGASFSSGQTPAATPVIPYWARVRNELQSQNRVDAGFVHGASAVTFLFSADQYVRYSGTYDGFVDEGYPKVITHMATADGVFPALPSELLPELRAFFAGTDGNLHVFSPAPSDPLVSQRYVSSASGSSLRPLNERWGIVDNALWDDEFVNAALRTVDGKLFLFSGDQYLRYSGSSRKNVDEGYPRKISTSYAQELGVPALSPVLNQGVDAALIIGTTHFYFVGDQVVSSLQPASARPLVEQWGLVRNRLQETQKLDAAFVAPNGKLYLFADDQYAVYSGVDRDYVDEEYPRVVATDIGALWPKDGTNFRAGLTAAAAFEGRSYLFKGASHVRISDFRLLSPDAGYPLGNAQKFLERYDFELGLLPNWWRIKQLFDDYAAQTPTLLQYLAGLDLTEPRFQLPGTAPEWVALARATQWSLDALKALLAILSLDVSALQDGRTLARLARCFELGDRIGTAPHKIKAELWDRIFVAPTPPATTATLLEAAADFLFQLIKAGTSSREWPEVSRALYNPAANAKRDAQVAYLLRNDPQLGAEPLQDENDLFERLLTDVQMDASLDTSNVVEAINSIQLFYHRALMRLEQVPSDVADELRRWWPWMKNYRIWEANRKVFLHPENYIRPELRTEKSPAFEALEEKLLQDEITAISVREGYQQYLEAFHEIARLRIVGGYHYAYVTEDDATPAPSKTSHRAVFMTGVSRTKPPVYYYRFGALPPVDADDDLPEYEVINWEPWQKVGIAIEADRVQPVFAFNRLFLFWIETKPYNSTNFSGADDESYSADSEGTKQVRVALKFSYYNFTKEWVAPQTVLLHPEDPTDPEVLPYVFSAQAAKNVSITANNPVPEGGTNRDRIFLTFRFLFWEWKLGSLSEGLDLTRDPNQRFRFKGLRLLGDQDTPFPAHLGIDPDDVTATVLWGEYRDEHKDEWFSFDAKGGTFLCRPTKQTPAGTPEPAPDEILGQKFDDVTGAFSVQVQGNEDADVFVFTQVDRTNRSTLSYRQYIKTNLPKWGPVVQAETAAWPWGRLAGVFVQDPALRISNVIVAAHEDTTFFLLGSRYFSYSGAYDVVAQSFFSQLAPDSPSLEQLIGAGVPSLSFAAATASGRSLVRAFKLPGADQAVLVSRAGSDPLGEVTLDLDQLRLVSASGGASPFDGWDTLDTVFQIAAPESVVFSRGADLVIFTWSSASWSTGTLAGSDTPSAAFLGLDGRLYFFSGDGYTEVDQTNLAAALTYQPVHPRWGQFPSLFSWLLHSVDGAVFGADDNLYLFSGDYCLRYDNFNARALDQLVLRNGSGGLLAEPPPKISEIWRNTSGAGQGIRKVTAAVANNGRIYLSGVGPALFGFVQAPVIVRYSQDDKESPFQADPGYPMAFIFESIPGLPTAFYARLFDKQETEYSIARLTSNTSEGFSRELFARGVPGLLSLATQKLPERPLFSQQSGDPPHDELYVSTKVKYYPGMGQDVAGLDFSDSNANAFYYWEIFFHIPFLIAQALKQEQRFEEAMHWYEYVFDPAVPNANGQYWNFLAFLDDAVFDRADLRQLGAQIDAYRDDPFDPHAIAELRPMAYRKAFVMSYVDNLLLWGDMLFRQYTRETVGEATMLYVRAADILGRRPEELGKRAMSNTANYNQLLPWPPLPPPPPAPPHKIALTDELLMLENGAPPLARYQSTWEVPHDRIFHTYFYIPENEEFVRYWDRVEDRLSKIRHGLNIDGVRQSLALFAPPVDVLALVQAFASGAGLAQALADYNAPIPHYRFAFMLSRARELTARLTGLGSALLAALEKKDAEELSLLRNTQERQILEMQLEVKQQQLDGARQSLLALHEGLKNAQARESHYQQLLAAGLTAHEQTQVAQMIVGQLFSQVSNVLSAASSVASFAPQVGSPFALTYGGQQIGPGILGMSNAFRAQAEMASFQSSLAATLGGWERRSQDWQLQKTLATGDTLQINRQIRGAEIQVEVANQEVQIQRRQIKNNQSVDTFMSSKFTNKQLHQWMIGKLSSTYFQTYNLALQSAKAAQRSLQFELGLAESEFKYVGAGYWDSLRKGLLAGEQLQLDLDKLEQAHIEANARRLEITRHVSLLQVAPLALLRLKEQGRCEFELGEALFDADFPGHYGRQIKTVSLSFPAVLGPYHNFNATLTQLAHRTLLAPDKKALGYMLGAAGSSLNDLVRVDWRPNQQVALSTGVNDSGLFQVNYSDERYLPFEGTGAVSTWRLEVNGVDGALHRQTLSDVIMTVQYTARQGGSAFAEATKSVLGKAPSERAWLLNLASDYSDAWQAFMNNPAAGIAFSVERRNLPGASERYVTGLYLHYELVSEPEDDVSRQALKLSPGADNPQLKPNSFKGDLSLPLLQPGQDPANATWRLTPLTASAASKFNPRNIRTIALVVVYQSKTRF